MANDHNNSNKLSRRSALRVLGQSVAGVAVLSAAAEARAEKCDGKIDKGSENMRKALQYVEKSKKKEQLCSSCLQYKAPKAKEKCGGCALFTGPVAPEGYCLSWAKKAK